MDPEALRTLALELGDGSTTPWTPEEGELMVHHQAYEISHPPPDPTSDTLHLTTLSGLVTYLKTELDALDPREHIVHVVSPTLVLVVSKTRGRHLNRDVPVEAVAELPDQVPDGSYQTLERYRVALNSRFAESDDRGILLELLRDVKTATVVTDTDDGLSQKLTVEQGGVAAKLGTLPNPVTLRPWRTFVGEVEQVESTFFLRLDGSGQVATMALFEADGGAWRRVAMERIALHLEDQLTDTGFVVVW